MDPSKLLATVEGFDWNHGNLEKNLVKHAVHFWETEEVFFHQPLIVRADRGHSASELRFYALGTTAEGRCLFVAFTLRNHLLRVISARDMTRRELAAFEHYEDKAYS